MTLRQKRPRVKLNSPAYVFQGNQALERYSWRCWECGSFENLQVHHLKPRGRLDSDTMTNLICLTSFLQRGQRAGCEAQRLCREGSEQKKNQCVRRNMKVEIHEAVQQHPGTAH